MTQPIALIKSSEPVRRIAMTPGRGRSPSVAVVYATRDGDLEVLDGGKPMGWGDQMFTRYRTRYEVDISDHHLFFEFKDDVPLPTQGDVYHFHATVSVSFRVADPAEVIRRNVVDAAALVRGHVLGVCRPITRLFSIEEAEEAEAAVRARFRRDALIQGGISLYAVEVRLSLDEAGRKYLQEVEQAARDDKVHEARHTTDVNDERRAGELDLLKQARDHALQERERLMLDGQPMDAMSAIRLHLQRNPTDTAGAMKMLAELEQVRYEHQQKQTERTMALYADLARQGMVNPADAATLAEAVTRQIEGSVSVDQASTDVTRPPAQAPPPALEWGVSLDGLIDSAPPRPAAPADEERPANVTPVYLLIDESVNDDIWVDGLNTVVTDVFGDLAARPRVASALRVAVLGFAENVEERVALGEQLAAGSPPGIVGRGSADHAELFRWLRDRVPEDLDVLRNRHRSVRPPVFIMLCSGAPGDAAWQSPRRQLLKADRHAEIVVFALDADPTAVADLASYPELAFVPESSDVGRGIGLFAAFLHQYLVDVGQAALDGTRTPAMEPAGFRPAE